MPREHQGPETLPREHKTKGEAVSVVSGVKVGVRKANYGVKALGFRRTDFRRLVNGLLSFTVTEEAK